MNKARFVKDIPEQYRNGKGYFTDLELENERFDNQQLQDIVFDNCSFYVSVRKADLNNAKFTNGHIKTCDLREAGLTNARFENLAVESAQFARARTEGLCFNNNWTYGQKLTKTGFDEWIKYQEE